MNIYLIKGRVDCQGYSEIVRVMENMEEKPKSFVGLGCRIDKSKIGRLEEGTFREQYQVYLTDKQEINAARKMIKEKIMAITKEKFERVKEELEHLNSHTLDSEIKNREF
ncbi:hypothetical protein [Metabacillus fastidiosus]|uniref:hypothetical protein n=1 Tax=Metabacillus fastidiosus TaxID=1458 RepID=UPI003D2B225C